MKILNYSTLALFIFLSISKAQVTQEWAERYGRTGVYRDEANSIVIDDLGNVYITGGSENNQFDLDYATIKYNSAGDSLWVRRYNGPGNSDDISTSIAIDNLGNVYVTGYSRNATAFGSEDYATIKYNSSGIQQWVQRYDGPGNSTDLATSITVDNSGNVYVTGYSLSGTAFGSEDYATIKYNSSGIQQWVQRYNGPGNSGDGATSIAVDNSGNVYVTGASGQSLLNQDYATIKYNSAGDSLWVRRYNGPGNSEDASTSIAIDNLGNVCVTGYSRSTTSSISADFATIKYDSSGTQQWVQRYNGPGDIFDYARSIATDNSGNVYVTGWSEGSAFYYDYATIKYNSAGDSLWVQRYDGPGNLDDKATSIAIDNSGNVYVTGGSEQSLNNDDCATIKYDSSGIQQWVQRYNGPGDGYDCANSVAVDNSGNVYVTGRSDDIGGNADYVTIKYSQQIGIKPVSTEIPAHYSLSQNFPNPFNPSTKIRFDIPQAGNVKLVIYDVLGSEVTTLVNQQLKPGRYETEWDAGNYASGIYFYTLTTESFNQTKRMVLIK